MPLSAGGDCEPVPSLDPGFPLPATVEPALSEDPGLLLSPVAGNPESAFPPDSGLPLAEGRWTVPVFFVHFVL